MEVYDSYINLPDLVLTRSKVMLAVPIEHLNISPHLILLHHLLRSHLQRIGDELAEVLAFSDEDDSHL